MSIPDQFLETVLFGLKILKFFDSDADLGCRIVMTLDPGLKKKREGSGSGSGSVPLTNGAGSGRPKNMRIRIPNTV
jgi:hypothetical protein